MNTNTFCGTRGPAVAARQRRSAEHAASLTIGERSTGYVVQVDLPGVSRDEIEITVDDGVLTVKGERKEPAHEGLKQVYSDRRFGLFSRSVRLPDDVDHSGVDAALTDGVLTIMLPRVPEARPRKIEIR